jgi:hypothetical protein
MVESGTYKPSDHGEPDAFSILDSIELQSQLDDLIQNVVEGEWSLYLQDDTLADEGVLMSGWTLTFSLAPEPGDPTLFISFSEGRVVLDWEGTFILEAADTLEGPYHSMMGVESSFEFVPEAAQQFFRLRR